MAWSDGESITGGGRHAWRDLTPDEYDEIVGSQKDDDDSMVLGAIDEMVGELKKRAMMVSEIDCSFPKVSRRIRRMATASIKANPSKYRLTKKSFLIGRKWTEFIGLVDGISEAVAIKRQQVEVDNTHVETE